MSTVQTRRTRHDLGLLHILLLEDDSGDARRVEKHLQKSVLETRLEWEERLSDGLEGARSTSPDVMIVDLGLPDSEGLATVRRCSEAVPSVPIVVLTGTKNLQTALEALEAGATEYLRKEELSPPLLARTLQWAVERKRIERTRQKSQGRLRRAQRIANLGYWERDLRTDTLIWSEETRRIFGWDEEADVTYETFMEAVHPEDRERLKAAQEAVLAGEEEKLDVEYRIRRPSGEERVIYEQGELRRNEEGEPVLVTGAVLDVTGRKRQQRELERLRNKYQGLLEGAPDAIFVADDETGRIVEANEAAATLMGATVEQIVGRHQSEIHPTEESEKYQTLFERHKQKAEAGPTTVGRLSDGSEIYVVTDSGEQVPVEINATLTEMAERTFFVGIFRDVTDRKKAEKELQRSNRALTALSRANQALVRTQSETELLQETCDIVVEAGYRLAWVGYAEEGKEKRVRPVAQAGYEEGYLSAIAVHWGDTELGQGPTGSAIRRGEPSLSQDILKDPEYALWREDALQRGYRSSAALPLRTKGEVVGALNVYASEPGAFDEREVELLQELADNLAYGIRALRHEKEAQVERRKFQNLTESLSEVVYRADPETFEVTYVNDSVEAVYGYAQQEWIENPKRWEESIHPDDKGRVISRLEDRREEGASGTLEYRIVRRDEEVRWVENHLSWEQDEEGALTSLNGIIYDVTKRNEQERKLREAKEEAEKANRMKSSFLANMSHEVRTPLTNINGFSDILVEELSAPHDELAERISRNGKRLLRTLTSVLQLSQLEAGEMGLPAEPVDLSAEIKEVMAGLEQRTEQSGPEVHVETGESPILAQANEEGVQIALRNLVANAVKYTEGVDEIWVRAWEAEDTVTIEVEDTGIGMKLEEMTELFKPFRQGSEGRSREYEGTGLGLAVTKRVVEQMDGTIEVETTKGEGSCFAIYLPRAGPASE